MAPPKQDAAKLSDSEIKLLGLAWQCFTAQPEIDWEKLAGLGGYTNIHSCQNVIRGAKKKIAETVGASSARPGRPPKRQAGKATAKEEDDDNENGAADAPPPAKKAKKAGTKKTTSQTRTRNGKNDKQDEGEAEDAANGTVKLEDMDEDDAVV